MKYLLQERNQELKIVWNPDREQDPEKQMKLYCDGEWLTQALVNLLKNASDYSEPGTEIVIEAEENRLYVKDHGMGIPKAALPHIFERFYRVNHEVNPNSVGIGLSLAKSIVEGMGGRLTVRSREGEYTWFLLTFVKQL